MKLLITLLSMYRRPLTLNRFTILIVVSSICIDFVL